ncbi:hypothetical protein CROQUDRAFT_92458 [Cronartium quercuum f. sp. fusiforme G11]|uniref:Uncharacterized protein n=1 Tax=Cronartium quercuum f. sp. fusiforme G11 TaxID=708437 RepID=A0A9P6TDE3_9BASI|nr:hypothetical protein CROQUDRAFT_92458 [Cronartium quercuum f. sp. fusiforme G11]
MEDYAGLGCWDDVCSQPRVKSFAQDPAAQCSRKYDSLEIQLPEGVVFTTPAMDPESLSAIRVTRASLVGTLAKGVIDRRKPDYRATGVGSRVPADIGTVHEAVVLTDGATASQILEVKTDPSPPTNLGRLNTSDCVSPSLTPPGSDADLEPIEVSEVDVGLESLEPKWDFKFLDFILSFGSHGSADR